MWQYPNCEKTQIMKNYKYKKNLETQNFKYDNNQTSNCDKT